MSRTSDEASQVSKSLTMPVLTGIAAARAPRSLRFTPDTLLFSGTARSYTTAISTKVARDNLLKKIYAPLNALDPKSLAWSRMAKSGKCWKDYHDPEGSAKYLKVQDELKEELASIDRLKDATDLGPYLFGLLLPEYTHQSTFIEQNPLELGDSVTINNQLEDGMFLQVDLRYIAADKLHELKFPSPKDLLPQKDTDPTAEMRNHIIASKWITLQATRFPKTMGLDNREICELQAVMIKDTVSERLHLHPGYGKSSKPGDYRTLPISVKSNPMRVFPYPMEVLQLMEQFEYWRNKTFQSGTYHPLVLACQISIYLQHIHPFPDGNGRIGRTVMYDFLMRQGYAPTILHSLDRNDYLKMVSDAQDADPSTFVRAIVRSQLEMLWTLKARQATKELIQPEPKNDNAV